MKIKAVYPGTFDPIHFGHIDIIQRSAELFEEVIVAVYDKPLKSLVFPFEERIALVRQAVQELALANVEAVGYNGLTVDFCRRVNAKVIIRGLRVFSDFEFEFRMALANRRLAPEVDIVNLITNEQHTFLSSTTVREIASLGGDVGTMVPPHVEAALKRRFRELGEDGSARVVPMTQLRD
ncbi:MAG: pantetheine-phosphate adenylyltransferase [Anaerolineales bacterium]|nr:pantetheine-phosphate adenylyltransferase [Anaerolineales bacterium]